MDFQVAQNHQEKRRGLIRSCVLILSGCLAGGGAAGGDHRPARRFRTHDEKPCKVCASFFDLTGRSRHGAHEQNNRNPPSSSGSGLDSQRHSSILERY
jgi:hypothetical protein